MLKKVEWESNFNELVKLIKYLINNNKNEFES